MKKKAMIMAVASLGSMALIGTGFAGWVISANAEVKANGTITAYDVKDRRLQVTGGTWETPVSKDDTSGAIIFGAPTAADKAKVTVANPWFTMDGMNEEVLKNTYSFTVKSGKGDTRTLSIVPTLTVYSKYVEGGSDNVVSAEYQTAIAEKAFIAPQEIVVTGNGTKLTGETAIDCSVKIAFKWGAKFGGDNPYVYYNGTDKSAAKDGDAAIADLAKINALNDQKFVLSVAISAN